MQYNTLSSSLFAPAGLTHAFGEQRSLYAHQPRNDPFIVANSTRGGPPFFPAVNYNPFGYFRKASGRQRITLDHCSIVENRDYAGSWATSGIVVDQSTRPGIPLNLPTDISFPRLTGVSVRDRFLMLDRERRWRALRGIVSNRRAHQVTDSESRQSFSHPLWLRPGPVQFVLCNL
jgi:hypothetical protein